MPHPAESLRVLRSGWGLRRVHHLASIDPSFGALLGAGAAAALTLLLGAALGIAAARRAQRRRDARFLETEAALRRSEDRLRWALAATSEIVWDWDLATDEIYQPSWAQTYGWPEERTPRTGKALLAFIHPEDVGRMGAEVERVRTGGDTFELEHRVLTASGDWKWMLGRGRVVARDAAGRARRIVGTCTDVTERKRLQTRLEIADRMASIGTLAAGVAHELNNPLAYVLGNVDFSLERLGAVDHAAAGEGGAARQALEECLAALREARTGAERMRDIIADVKLFSRAAEERRVPVQVGAALRAALSLADHEIRHRARIVVDVAPVPPVSANESRLSQAFLNLLVNAAQAIPEGHADRNEIRVTVRTDAAGRVEIAVRDTGSGIPAEHRKRLFDPFFTTKPVGIGTGLGLSICHGIVTALGGTIDVESEVGKGSTFRIALPAVGTDAASGEAGTAAASPRAADAPVPPRARVLFVDDEPLFGRLMARALSADHDAEALSDGGEALRRLRAGERFDLVIADLAMPVLTGMELHAEIARIDPDLAGRMLFVTGGAFTPETAAFVAGHAEQVLAKPLAPEALREKVRAALRGLRPAADAPAA
jgi:PAS domain S-box-containing protein